jgi:hypothetical protein
MQIFAFAFSLLLVTTAAASAQIPQIERIDFMEYGIYTVDREIEGRDALGINKAAASNVRHAATMRTIPAQLGTTFGFRYKVIGKPDGATVTLRKVIIFPSPGLQTSASSERVPKAEFTVEAKIGETNSELYTLEDTFELVAGTWVLEMWQGSRKLATQSFKLDKRAEKPDTEKPDRKKPDSKKPDSGCIRDCEGL